MALSLTLQIRAVYARACEAPKDEKQNMKCPSPSAEHQGESYCSSHNTKYLRHQGCSELSWEHRRHCYSPQTQHLLTVIGTDH
ncbi:unnamed protein product [Gadus morhua 'NCC']